MLKKFQNSIYYTGKDYSFVTQLSTYIDKNLESCFGFHSIFASQTQIAI